jgi:hypothetical protein
MRCLQKKEPKRTKNSEAIPLQKGRIPSESCLYLFYDNYGKIRSKVNSRGVKDE